MKIISQNNSFFNWLYKYRKHFLVFVLFIFSFFLRLYGISDRYPFGWDQVDNAWAAKNIIVNREYPLIGMAAKQNTGFFIGPAYYYFAASFYWLTDLNPVASQYIALTTSIFTFFVIFFVIKKLFNFKVALIACFINVVSFAGLSFDSVQWPVSFLPGISLLIFYFLYKLLKGEEKYIFFLAIMIGLAFHIHFTAIFFPIIVILSLPFFPLNRKMFFYSLLSIPLFLVWFTPNLISQMQNNSQLSNMSNYLNTYYHGLHLTRFIQLTGDGLIQFDPFLSFAMIKPFKIFILPLFLLVFFKEKISREKIVFSYLILIYFLVPWFVFSTYSGEISDYYYSANRFIALLVMSYLVSKTFQYRNIIVKVTIITILIFYMAFNLQKFFSSAVIDNLKDKASSVQQAIKEGKEIGFYEGASDSYLYYYYMRKKGIEVY